MIKGFVKYLRQGPCAIVLGDVEGIYEAPWPPPKRTGTGFRPSCTGTLASNDLAGQL